MLTKAGAQNGKPGKQAALNHGAFLSGLCMLTTLYASPTSPIVGSDQVAEGNSVYGKEEPSLEEWE